MPKTQNAETPVVCPHCGSSEFQIEVDKRQVLVGQLERIAPEDPEFDDVAFQPAPTTQLKWDQEPRYSFTCAGCNRELSAYEIDEGPFEREQEAPPLACPSCGASDGKFYQWQHGSFAWGCVLRSDGSYDQSDGPQEWGDDVSGIEAWECRHCHTRFSEHELGVAS